MCAPAIAAWLLAHVLVAFGPPGGPGALRCVDEAGPALGVVCPPAGEDTLGAALARFQRRHGRSLDEASGRLDERTWRYLRMVHDSLRAPDDPCLGTSPPRAGELRSCELRWPGASAEQMAFMRDVYESHVRSSRGRRPPVLATDDDVAEIEAGATARRDVADAARRLLAAARAAASPGGDLGIVTGYRSAPFQLEIWEYHFPQRYADSAKARGRAPGGAHGPAAATLLASRFSSRTAAPGFSLHQRGQAIDLRCVEPGGAELGATGSFRARWKRSWCWRWLGNHGASHGFHLNEDIDEPWHWEYRER